MWRIAFLLGGIASLVSYFLRKNLALTPHADVFSMPQEKNIYPRQQAIMTTLLLGMLLSIFSWLPVTYVNFYFTKILHTTVEVGLSATLLAIIPGLFLKPLFGKLSDYYPYFSYLSVISFLAVPLIVVGFYLMTQANILGQLPLVFIAAAFSGPVHAIMNRLFPKEHRSRSINFFFILGACIGGLAPSLFGFVVDKTGFTFSLRL